MAEQIFTVGIGGDYADFAAARTANFSRNLITEDTTGEGLVVRFQGINGMTVPGNASKYETTGTDATHYFVMEPHPDLSVIGLNPGGVYGFPSTGLQLTLNITGAASAFRMGRGWRLEGFVMEANMGGSVPAIIYETACPFAAFRKNYLRGANTSNFLLQVSNSSTLGMPEIEDNVIIGTGNGTVAVCRFLNRTMAQRNTVVSTGTSPAFQIDHGGTTSGIYRNNKFRGAGVVNLTSANGNATEVGLSGSNYTTGAVTFTGAGTNQYASTKFNPNRTDNDLFETVPTDLRSRAGSVTIDAADDTANNTADINGRSRGMAPDVGAHQRAAGVPLPSATFNTPTVNGQSVTLGGTVTGAVSGVASVGSDVRSVVITGSNWAIGPWVDLPPGSYPTAVTFLNSEGGPLTLTGATVIISVTGGNPEGPPPAATAPAFSTQPANVTVTAGLSASINWATTGTEPITATLYTRANSGASWDAGTSVASPHSLGVLALSANGRQHRIGLVNEVNPGAPVYSDIITLTVNADVSAPQMQGTVSLSALTQTSYTTGCDAATDNVGVTGYRVSQDGGTTWIDKATSRTHNHTGRTPGATDAVQWSARDAAGNWATAITRSVQLSAVPAPVITTQPQPASVVEGSGTTLAAAATVSTGTLSWQWFSRPAGDTTTGTAVSGATGSSLPTGPLLLAQDGIEYRARARNTISGVTADTFTSWAAVDVTSAAVEPVITTQPQGQLRNPGQTGNFSVAATGTAPLSIRWYFKGAIVSGAMDSTTMETPVLSEADDGAEVFCVVENSAGSAVSDLAVLEVRDTIPPLVSAVSSAAVDSTTARTSAITTEANGAVYWMTASGAAPARQQVIDQGTSRAVNSTELLNLVSAGLTPGVVYRTYVVHVDAAGNPSTLAQSNSFTLSAVLPPGPGGVLSGISPPALFQLLAAAGES